MQNMRVVGVSEVNAEKPIERPVTQAAEGQEK